MATVAEGGTVAVEAGMQVEPADLHISQVTLDAGQLNNPRSLMQEVKPIMNLDPWRSLTGFHILSPICKCQMETHPSYRRQAELKQGIPGMAMPELLTSTPKA